MIKDSVLFMLYHFNFLLPIEMIKDTKGVIRSHRTRADNTMAKRKRTHH